VPPGKLRRGYSFEPNKFEIAGLNPIHSEIVNAPRVKECPVQLEAIVMAVHPVGEEDLNMKGRIVSIELKIVKVHLEETILKEGNVNRVDPDKWRPLIMSFQQFYGLGDQVQSSRLAQIPEHLYKAG
jgi:flavin reductase (DIM6/NTAB) family NADH-FMN oxidoreductase RutF